MQVFQYLAKSVKIPPLLVLFPNLEIFEKAVKASGLEAFNNEISYLFNAKLPPAVSNKIVALLFGYSPRFIEAMKRWPRKYYRIFNIYKGKKKRTIESPKVSLKLIQRWLAYHLARGVNLPECVHGFVPGKSSITAALCHCGAEWVVSLDLKDFFPTTTIEHIKPALLELGYGELASVTILNLCTLNNHLPQGSPASPVLSNLAFKYLDIDFQKLAESNNYCYTRYADDLVFSGKGILPDGLYEEVCERVVRNGWTIAEHKTKISSKPSRLIVHGLLVQGTKPRLPKAYRNRIRMMRYLISKNILDSETRSVFLGHDSYAKGVEKVSEG